MQEIIAEKNPELANREQVAEEVGIGAVIFHNLKNSRMRDIIFDWNEVLNFDGETGQMCIRDRSSGGGASRKF